MRIRIGSGFGIPVYLHGTFFLLPLWITWTYTANPFFSLPVTLIGSLVVFGCIVLHEFGHALMARRFGIPTQDVTLYPIGGVARLTKMTDKPLEELLIAVAGPAVNVVIAFVLACVWLPLSVVDGDLAMDSFLGSMTLLVLVSNVGLVVFNMLPLFPMDGGRVLRALVSWGLGHYRATQIAVGVGLGAALLLALLMAVSGVGFNPMLIIVLIFVFFAGQQELLVARMLEQRRLARQNEEPLEVLPARPEWMRPFDPQRVIFIWDRQTGTWRQEPQAP